MSVDLTAYVQKVWVASDLDSKKTAMLELINASHAKADTKRLFTTKINMERNPRRLDTLASNYAMSGEGMKVK